MQRKHLIAFTMATIFLLLGFNIINGQQHERSRAAPVENTVPIEPIETETRTAVDMGSSNTNSDTANKPLGQQPKAIIDNVTADIEQAQQMDKDRLETSLDSAE